MYGPRRVEHYDPIGSLSERYQEKWGPIHDGSSEPEQAVLGDLIAAFGALIVLSGVLIALFQVSSRGVERYWPDRQLRPVDRQLRPNELALQNFYREGYIECTSAQLEDLSGGLRGYKCIQDRELLKHRERLDELWGPYRGSSSKVVRMDF